MRVVPHANANANANTHSNADCGAWFAVPNAGGFHLHVHVGRHRPSRVVRQQHFWERHGTLHGWCAELLHLEQRHVLIASRCLLLGVSRRPVSELKGEE